MSKELLNNLLVESSLVSTENFSGQVPDSVLAEYTLLEPANLFDVPKEFMEKVAKIGDESPMFVTWAMPSGFSRYMEPESVGNENEPKTPHRYWPEEVIHNFAEQIRERSRVGYGGHAGMFDYNSIPENIPVLWVSAVKARRKSDNRGVTLAHGYVTRQGNFRENLTLGIIDSASVSSVGTTKRKTREEDNKEYDEVQSGAALLSFDLVRKDTHGVPNTRLVASLAQEEPFMEFTPEQKELISKLTSEQLAAFNPTLVESIRGEESGEASRAYRTRIDELVAENIAASRDTQLVLRLSETFGVEKSKLEETANNIISSNRQVIEHAAELAVKDLKKPELREQVKQAILDRKPTSPAQVDEFFKSEMSKLQGMIELMAGERGIGHVPATSRSGGNGVIASFLQGGNG